MANRNYDPFFFQPLFQNLRFLLCLRCLVLYCVQCYTVSGVIQCLVLHGVYCIVLYLYIYIALLAVHTNEKRFQCERPREKRAVLRERKQCYSVSGVIQCLVLHCVWYYTVSRVIVPSAMQCLALHCVWCYIVSSVTQCQVLYSVWCYTVSGALQSLVLYSV